MNYGQDEKVSYDNGVVKGTGKVVGIATNGQAVIGKSYIIQPDVPITNETYPYTHFTIFEIHLKSLIDDKAEERRDSPHHHKNRLD